MIFIFRSWYIICALEVLNLWFQISPDFVCILIVLPKVRRLLCFYLVEFSRFIGLRIFLGPSSFLGCGIWSTSDFSKVISSERVMNMLDLFFVRSLQIPVQYPHLCHHLDTMFYILIYSSMLLWKAWHSGVFTRHSVRRLRIMRTEVYIHNFP